MTSDGTSLRSWTITVRGEPSFARNAARALRLVAAERPYGNVRETFIEIAAALERADRLARTEP